MSDSTSLPIVDLDIFLNQPRDSPAVIEECKKATDALIEYGALLLHDSRVPEDANEKFIDILEDYFNRPAAEICKDERPEQDWQTGVTPEFTSRPKCAIEETCVDIINKLAPSERPVDVSHRPADPKWRYFWRMGEKLPFETQFPELNPTNVMPEAEEFKPHWESIMTTWGSALKHSIEPLSQMLALGLGIPVNTFTDAGKYGPHILGPTASDMEKYSKKDTIIAGFHYDLNFFSIHGRSRFPSLHIWARNSGKRMLARIPKEGPYLLVQAGKQLEHFTGGLIKAGYHEVVVNDATLEAMKRRKAAFPDRPLIRVSSTLFYHLGSDYDLAPIPELAERGHRLTIELNEREEEYKPMKVGDQVRNILDMNGLLGQGAAKVAAH